MLFNSIEFLIFLPLVFAMYWVLRSSRSGQNALLLVASYLFYGWWDWRFLSLIFLSSLLDYFLGAAIAGTLEKIRKRTFVAISLTVNLGLLGFFKYYNFFVTEFIEAFSSLGLELNAMTLKVILPVGISFYTFQTLSYTLDVYKGRIEACKDPLAFFTFVSFFPQLVAGPIERASNLIPQFENERSFDTEESIKGLKQILWGLFKKVVIADSCARHVDFIFVNYETLPGSLLLLGAVYFAFQIYGDFSGYSDIAVGTARLFGVSLMRNFAYPYFSRDIAEFWRRWHISLSAWFRDYLYIPLGGSRVSKSKAIRNIFTIFLVSGFWHGANWTFLVWGGLNAVYFLPSFILKRNRKFVDEIAGANWLPSFREFIGIIITFSLTCFAWIFFRADNLTEATSYIQNMLSSSLLSSPGNPNLTLTPLYLITVFHFAEWIFRKREVSLEALQTPRVLRWGIYYVLIYMIVYFSDSEISFIYFQF